MEGQFVMQDRNGSSQTVLLEGNEPPKVSHEIGVLDISHSERRLKKALEG